MKNIFIGCSSYDTIDSKYLILAKEVGSLIISKNYKLVFGARNNGMMGVLYNEYKNHHKEIEAITIESYKEDLNGLECEKKIFENTIKQVEYFLKSDILLFLPGGIGSLNEFMCSITAKRNNETNSKIILFNYNNYYDELLNIFRKFEENGFSKKEDLFVVVTNIKELEKEI